MSFIIVLQTNASENNRLDKTVTDIITLDGVLRDESSIMNPSVLVQASPSTLATCNYATISAFGRKYFVTNIQAYRGALTRVDMKCDVLSSFATEIRACQGIVYKQEKLWNLYLDDGTFKVYQNPILGSYVFPNGFNTMQFVLAVSGRP